MQLLSSLSSKISFSVFFWGGGSGIYFIFSSNSKAHSNEMFQTLWINLSPLKDRPLCSESCSHKILLVSEMIFHSFGDGAPSWSPWISTWCLLHGTADTKLAFELCGCPLALCQSLEGILTSSGVGIRDPWAAPIPSTACVMYRGL